ncbi:hypothetical protein B296_00049805, partial [Ensete ventricosum]
MISRNTAKGALGTKHVGGSTPQQRSRDSHSRIVQGIASRGAEIGPPNISSPMLDID